MMKRNAGFAVFVAIGLLAAASCEFPFSQIERPAFDNPRDPDSRVPIEDVIALIEAENPTPGPLVLAILGTGARYNTDVEELWFEYSANPIDDFTGVAYLPSLRRCAIRSGAGTATINLSGFAGHLGIEELEVSGFDASVLSTIPPLANLRMLDISGTTGTGVDFSAMFEQNLEELVAEDAGITTLNDIERLGGIRRLNIFRGGTSTYPIADLDDELIALADSLEEVRSPVPTSVSSFIGLYPNLSGVRFFVSGALSSTLLAEIAAYDRITRMGFDDVSTVDTGALASLSGSPITDLEIHQSAVSSLDVADLATTSLVRLNLSSFSLITNIASLPDTLEIIEFIDVGMTPVGMELDAIAANLPNLRILDISRNTSIESLLPLSANATTMANLEEIRADQDTVGGSPVPPWGIDSTVPANGIAALAVLPNLRILSIRNSTAAYQYTLTNADIGLDALRAALDQIEIDAFSEDA